MYTLDHKGIFPPSLAFLSRKQNIPSQILECPADDQPDGIDYQYIGQNLNKQELTELPRTVLVFDKKSNHKNGFNVLFANCQEVKFVFADTMQKALAKHSWHLPGNQNETKDTENLQWGTQKEGFRMSITPSKDRMRIGGPLVLTARIKNASDKRLRLPLSKWERVFSVLIRTSQGDLLKKVPDAEYRKKLREKQSLYSTIKREEILPGEAIKSKLRVTKYYDFSQSGTYKIQVHRRIYGKRRSLGIPRSRLSSNVVEIYFTK